MPEGLWVLKPINGGSDHFALAQELKGAGVKPKADSAPVTGDNAT